MTAAQVPRGETGYAMLAAVVAIALLGLMSLSLIDTSRGVTAGALAEAERARLAAAADAGTALAAAALADPDRTRRWSIDGRPRNFSFGGTSLVIRVEDERGKIPLNQLTEEQMRVLFEALGSDRQATEIQVDALLDWIDDDDDPREDGAEANWYARFGIRPRNGALHSLGELALVRGMTPALVERLRGPVSIYRDGREGFDERYAVPLALTVMHGGGPDTPDVIDRQRELAGQRVAIELAPGESLVGRPLSIVVEARRPGGGFLQRRSGIELTGWPDKPYVVRSVG